MNSQIYESHLHKGQRDTEFVSMKLDGAEYMFDLKTGQWKMNSKYIYIKKLNSFG